MKLPRIKASLTTKLSLLVTGAVLLVLAVLGFYFDDFLRESFLNGTEKRMQHGFKRLAVDLRDVEQALRDGVAFVRNDEGMIASIELINNYQNKKNYNTFLIDEEKKAIADELLSRVKLSFNRDIAIYDRDQELVAFVVKQVSGYRLYFISFEGGESRLFSRLEQQNDYVSEPFTLPQGIIPAHFRYYSDAAVYNQGLVTYRRGGEALVVKSHQDLVEQHSGQVIGHIEMSNYLDADWFEHMSRDLDIDMSFSFDPAGAQLAQPLGVGIEVPQVAVRQTDTEYVGVMSRDLKEGQVYFFARLDKTALQTILNQNRKQFLSLLGLVATATLLLMRLPIRLGLTRPLAALMEQIKRIEQRDYATSEALTTGDELEAISNSVNRLANAVRDRETSLELSRRDLETLSNQDPLTELPNRRFFAERLKHAIDLAGRRNEQLALFVLDLDQFKLVNDTLGHDVGDTLLVQVAERLRGHVRHADTLARFGGDEFTVLVENPGEMHELEVIVARYLELFQRPFHCDGREISTTASIGVSLFPDDGEDMVTLIKNADLAMYKSKDSGRNSCSFYALELSDEIRERAQMMFALKAAIEEDDQFELYYQPKISLLSGKIDAVEALIRWHSPAYGFLSPERFIPLAEETGLIVSIGERVLQQGCRDFVQLKQEGILLGQISINLSNVQLHHNDRLQVVRRAMEQSGIPPEELELEITESYIATNIEEVVSVLKDFRAMGVRLAVDDFGTGYSSMSYLQQMPVTRIKIDKSFVDGLPHNRDSVAIVRAIIGLAKNFGLEVTAEGVEHDAQVRFLQREGCDEVQGFHFAKPMSLRDLKAFYRSQVSGGNVIPLDTRRDH